MINFYTRFLEVPYNYFSTKHINYPKECLRIVFFKENFPLDSLLNLEYEQPESQNLEFNDLCLGFVCLRPIFPQFISRSVISPKAFKGSSNYETCTLDSDILVSGYRFPIVGFPFTSQDNEYNKCAETVIWMCLEYFGSKYQEFKTVPPSEILEILSRYTFERQVPSHGLSAEQISFVLKDLNFGVRIYDRNSYTLGNTYPAGLSEFHRILHYYVDSAIPVICILKSKDNKIAHAVLYTGYECPTDKSFIDYDKNFKSYISEEDNRWSDYSGLITKYVVCDDNRLPYQRGNFTDSNNFEGRHLYSNYYGNQDKRFKDLELSSFIVPLPSKVYLEASQARDFIIGVLEQKEIRVDKKDLVLRTFFTTSRSFKNWITTQSTIDKTLKKIIINTPMPKFIWVGELSSLELIKTKDSANGFILIDATQPNVKDMNDCLFIWHKGFVAYTEKGKWKIASIDKIDNSFIMYKNFKKWKNGK